LRRKKSQESNDLVLDSYALIGYLENESFSDQIEKVLNLAKRGQARLYLHAINLGEVYCITLRRAGRDLADLAYARIKAFPVERIESLDEELLLTAATLKAGFPISYADAFVAATAKTRGCPLLTGDPEFEALENDGIIAVKWLK